MKRIMLRTRHGQLILFDNLTTLSRDERKRLSRGESITYEGKTFIPTSTANVYVEETHSMRLHPLAKLDREIKRGN